MFKTGQEIRDRCDVLFAQGWTIDQIYKDLIATRNELWDSDNLENLQQAKLIDVAVHTWQFFAKARG